jgi:phosphotransferase system enzyme I (PtsP)
VNRAIAKIVRAADRQGIDVSVCGEMAHEKDSIPFLLGVGIRILSVDPQFLPAVQKTIQNLNLSAAEKFAENMLAQTTIKGVNQVLSEANPEIL